MPAPDSGTPSTEAIISTGSNCTIMVPTKTRGPLKGCRVDTNIRKIQAFCVAARLGSISAAARELGSAQSTLSRSISSLEDDWGIRLFERKGPELRLTTDGKRLLEESLELCESFSRLERRVHGVRGLDDGVLGIAAPASVVSMRLPGPLGRFVSDHPGVEVKIAECTYGEASRLLLEGLVDLAFIPSEPEGRDFVSTVYDKDEIVIVAPCGHFKTDSKTISVNDLINERFIADTETAPLLQRELTKLQIHCETSDITAILAMVEAGLGVSLLPSLALERAGFDLDVRHLEHPAFRSIYLVRRRTVDLSIAARAFLEYL